MMMTNFNENQPKYSIIETAVRDYFSFLSFGRLDSLADYNNSLDTWVYDNFKRYRDQNEALLLLKKLVLEDQAKAKELEAKRNYTQLHKPFDLILHIIDVKLEEISDYIEEPAKEKTFSPQEKSEMSNKIDEVIAKMKEQYNLSNAAFEVLFEELQDLKERMNYDKKTWRQLMTGKLVEVVSTGVVDKAVGNKIYESIAPYIDKSIKFISGL